MTTETKVKQCLKKFGFDKFRSDIQENAILSIINGNSDVFISFPTGGGKSLCYQFPAVYKEDGLSLVISPLLALIQDQVETLNAKQIVARTLNSTLSQQEKKIVLGDLMQRQPTTRLLYITPELAATQSFLSIIKKVHARNLVNYLIIDEAHCVSQWGHDYRPDYLKLGILHDELNNVPCIAVTATASQQVIDDIFSSLHLRQPVLQFQASVFRSNLFYDVQFKELLDDPFIDLCEFIQETKNETKSQLTSGIIYCRTRDSCSDLANRLSQTGKCGLVKAYHAGLTNDKRTQIQSEWMNGTTHIICATISFGMGIDKGDVRFVVHWDLAKSISGYYQESGRAGRDGNRSHCRMYYSTRERDTQMFLINQEINDKKIVDEQKMSMINGFNALVQYCEQATCRHWVICNYFGDMSMKPCETMCDVCMQGDLVLANLQNLKKKKSDDTINRRSAGLIMYRNAGSEEQYEGGRPGNRRDEREYRDTDDDYRRDDDEINSAKLATKLVQNELKRRAVAMETKPKAWTAAGANCPLIDPGNRKMPNVTVQLREHVCWKLQEALIENVEKHFAKNEEQQIANKASCHEKAVGLEYQVFMATKSEPMYKMKWMSKCNEISKATKNNCSLYVVDSMPSNASTESSSSSPPRTSIKRKLSETEMPNVEEPETKVVKQNGHSEEESKSESVPMIAQTTTPVEQQSLDKFVQLLTQPASSSPSGLEKKSNNRTRSSSSSSSTSSSSSSAHSASSSSTSSSSSSASSPTGDRSAPTSPKVKMNSKLPVEVKKKEKLQKKVPLKRTNGEVTKEKKLEKRSISVNYRPQTSKSKSLHHSFSSSNAKSQSTIRRHRHNSLSIPPPPPPDIKAKQARGTLKTCLESMSNFLHQKLNEQPVLHSIQSPSEEPIPPLGTSSPSFLNDQEQETVAVGNRERKTSLDERIRSLLNHGDDFEGKKDNGTTNTIKDATTINTRKSLPLPPVTMDSDSDDEQSRVPSRKRSNSMGSKSTSRKSSASSSMSSKRVSLSAAGGTERTSTSGNHKSSSKKSRESRLPVNIKTISEVVVDVLNPFYQANRFSSKELFKTLAKRISQYLATKDCSNIDAVRMDAKSLIKPAFRHKHSKIMTHADLDRIVPPR